MLRLARLISVLSGAAVVAVLAKVHARFVAVPPYDLTGSSRFAWALVYAALLAVAAYASGLPERPRNARDAAVTGFAAALMAAVGVSIAQLAAGDALLPRFVVFDTVLAMIPIQVLANRLARHGTEVRSGRDRVVVVTTRSEYERLSDALHDSPERPAVLVGHLEGKPAAGTPGTHPLVDLCLRADASVLVLDNRSLAGDRLVAQAAVLHERGVRIRSLSGFYEEWLGKLPLSELERASLFFDIGELHRSRYGRVKRLMDVAAGLVGLVVLASAIPVVLVGNAVANRGRLWFRQIRVGRGGREFTVWKFRTMSEGDAARWTSEDDPRVTRFGAVLRRSHLDELPQVWNIVRGDLSLVGPRPEQPHYVAELADKLAFYDLRHRVRPGLTGWAQIKYGYAGNDHDAMEKLQYEFFYLRHQDIAFDVRIVVRTLRSLVGGPGTGR
ncbi:MAG: sugar transferase [Microthrixaceae bacterium]